jgi:hypothetical protein
VSELLESVHAPLLVERSLRAKQKRHTQASSTCWLISKLITQMIITLYLSVDGASICRQGPSRSGSIYNHNVEVNQLLPSASLGLTNFLSCIFRNGSGSTSFHQLVYKLIKNQLISLWRRAESMRKYVATIASGGKGTSSELRLGITSALSKRATLAKASCLCRDYIC